LGGDVLFLLDHLGADRANFCGLSLGGVTGQWLGVHSPERFPRLVLANTAARIGTVEMWDQRIAAAKGPGMEALAPAVLDRWFTQAYRERHPEEMAFVRGMIASTDPRGYIACCEVLRDADLRAEAASIQTPCLVITGTHDPATPASDGRALAQALRNSRSVELDSSHMSAWERPEEFADAVLAFLETEERANG
jgi:3-oxoadipate enol-lactonase